ncbi:MAG: type III-B CRISPR module-associated protein Cmr5 [Pedobacter sp.]
MPDLTLSQRRAAFALNQVNALKDADDYGKYASYVKALPAAILMNGLGQAAATLLAGDEPHKQLYGHLSSWLCGNMSEMPYSGAPDLIQAIVSNDQNLYLRAQAESLLFLEWLKKFATAFLENGTGV